MCQCFLSKFCLHLIDLVFLLWSANCVMISYSSRSPVTLSGHSTENNSSSQTLVNGPPVWALADLCSSFSHVLCFISRMTFSCVVISMNSLPSSLSVLLLSFSALDSVTCVTNSTSKCKFSHNLDHPVIHLCAINSENSAVCFIFCLDISRFPPPQTPSWWMLLDQLISWICGDRTGNRFVYVHFTELVWQWDWLHDPAARILKV